MLKLQKILKYYVIVCIISKDMSIKITKSITLCYNLQILKNCEKKCESI